MTTKGHKNPMESKNGIGEDPFFFRMVQLNVFGSYPSLPQISKSGSNIIPNEINLKWILLKTNNKLYPHHLGTKCYITKLKYDTNHTTVTMILARLTLNLSTWFGKKTPVKRFTATRAMLWAETPMLAKKKKVKSLHETPKSKIHFLFINLKFVSLKNLFKSPEKKIRGRRWQAANLPVLIV